MTDTQIFWEEVELQEKKERKKENWSFNNFIVYKDIKEFQGKGVWWIIALIIKMYLLYLSSICLLYKEYPYFLYIYLIYFILSMKNLFSYLPGYGKSSMICGSKWGRFIIITCSSTFTSLGTWFIKYLYGLVNYFRIFQS